MNYLEHCKYKAILGSIIDVAMFKYIFIILIRYSIISNKYFYLKLYYTPFGITLLFREKNYPSETVVINIMNVYTLYEAIRVFEELIIINDFFF